VSFLTENKLLQGDVPSALLRFALPFLGASLIQFLYGTIDMMVVGRFGDAAGVSAVATGSQVMQALTGLVTGLTAGGTVLIGQYTGAGRSEDVKRAVGTIFSLFAALALAGAAVLALASGAIVSMMQTPAGAVAPARQYVFTCSCGLVFITGYNAACGVLRGLGDSKRPMLFIGISCCVNIAGDLLLVGAFGLGALGTAIATIFAQAVSMVLALVFLCRGEYARYFSLRPDGGTAGRLLRLGLPIALQNFLTDLSFLLITAIVNHIGLDQSAAVGVAERIIGIGILVPFAFMSAISAMTAQNIGAGKPERAFAAARYGVLFCLIPGVLALAALQFFPQWAMGLFIDDAAVIGHGVLYLRSYSFDCLLVCLVFCLNGFFSGCGRTGFTMANCLIATFAVRVPAVWLISRMSGVTLFHIGLASPMASLLQIAIQLWYLKRGTWKTAEVPYSQRT